MPIYIKLPDVKGQTQVTAHKEELEVSSVAFGVSMHVATATTNKTRTHGAANFQEITVSRESDSATPQLLQKLASGTVLAGDTVISFVREDQDAVLPHIVITLTDVILSNLSISSSSDVPYESFSMNYAKIKVEYTTQKEEGGKAGVAPFGWDISLNEAAS